MSEAYDFAGGIDARIAAVNDCFQRWCKSRNFRPRLRCLTKAILGWRSTTVFPEGAWSKGSTSRVLAKWYVQECQQHVNVRASNQLLEVAFQAASYAENFLRGLYSFEVFLPKADAKRIATHGLTFLKLYGRWVWMAWRDGKALFMKRPNFHRLHHILTEMISQSDVVDAQYVISPLAYSTQPDEDFIGRPSRLSRRVSPRLSVQRALQRSLIAASAAYTKAGLLINGV
eukprot:Skav215262  [mRNA]  locus=scaffold2881:7081:7767:- [translate_table: standard]